MLVAFAAAGPASAHEDGEALPQVGLELTDPVDFERTLTVTVTDADGGGPIEGAVVETRARMTAPHDMRSYFGPLPEEAPGRYEGRVRFPMGAEWTIDVSVSGPSIRATEATFVADIPARSIPAGAVESDSVERLAVRVESEVTGRDVLSIALLWLHGVAAAGWLLGLGLMLVVIARPRLLGEHASDALVAAYRRVGARVHWALVPVVVATGVYNLVRVAPFDLAWTPSGIDRLAGIPHATLYESILLAKLVLFAALLVSAAAAMRAIRPDSLQRGRRTGLLGTLGPSGVAYVASSLLILGAAAALRYVHVLSHVAQAAAGG